MLEENEDESINDINILRDQMILNEMEINHSKRLEQLEALLNVYVSDQIEHFKREKEEYLYFLSPDDPQIYSLEQKLVTTHSEKLIENLEKEEEGIPKIFLAYASELLGDSLHNLLNVNKNELKTPQDVQDFVDEWHKFTTTMLDSIYEGNSQFWDVNILDNQSDLVVEFLNLFLYCQNISNDKEQDELRH